MSSDRSTRRFWLAGKREPAQDLFFRESLDPAQWRQGDEQDWDTCWYTGMPAPEVFEALSAGKTINHIPGNNSLTVKSNLHANLAAMRDRIREQEGEPSEAHRRAEFFPRVYPIPSQYHALQEAAAANPERRWILKPRNSARGKDIRVVDDVATVPLDNRWMVQQYVDDPHTIDGHKYVLRLYVLVSSVEPLRVYLFEEGSAKLASAPYSLDNIANPYAHLTNPDVNATNQESDTPVVFISLARYREWLRGQGHDDVRLFERLHDLVVLTMIAARERMRTRTRAVAADTSGCYELLGLDCLVDADLRPWILECNLSPSLDVCAAPADGGDVEAYNKRRLVEDLVALIGINQPSPGPFPADPAERLRAEAETELERAGGYIRLYPNTEPERYLPFFAMPRLADMVLAEAVAGRPLTRPTVRAHRTAEVISGHRLDLYSETSRTLFAPNPTAAWIWLKATEGANPDAIADELLSNLATEARTPDTEWRIRHEVWDVLADWAESGMLRQRSDGAADSPEVDASREAAPQRESPLEDETRRREIGLLAGDGRLRLSTTADPVLARLAPPLAPLLGEAQAGQPLVSVMASDRGYAIAVGGRKRLDGLTLGRVTPAICRLIQEFAASAPGQCAIAGTVVPLPDVDRAKREAVFIPQHQGMGWDRLAVALGARLGSGHSGGLWLSPGDRFVTRALGLPARVPVAEAQATGGSHIHQWRDDTRGHLLPASVDGCRERYQVTAVIVPAYDDGEPADVSRALATLLPLATGPMGQGLDARTVSALGTWLAGLDIRTAGDGDAGSLADAMVAAAPP